jgi:hypothetical protein
MRLYVNQEITVSRNNTETIMIIVLGLPHSGSLISSGELSDIGLKRYETIRDEKLTIKTGNDIKTEELNFHRFI